MSYQDLSNSMPATAEHITLVVMKCDFSHEQRLKGYFIIPEPPWNKPPHVLTVLSYLLCRSIRCGEAAAPPVLIDRGSHEDGDWRGSRQSPPPIGPFSRGPNLGWRR